MTQKHIAIADDDDFIHLMIESALTPEFSLAAFSDGQSLLDYVADHPTDVILLDVVMPDLSGFETCDRLKRDSRTSAIPVIFLSAANDLLQAIDAVLAGRRHLTGEVADLAVRGLTARDEQSALASLSPRERQMVELVVRGRSSAEIGSLLHLSPKTVDSYRSRLMAKLGVADVPALVRFAIRAGLLDADER